MLTGNRQRHPVQGQYHLDVRAGRLVGPRALHNNPHERLALSVVRQVSLGVLTSHRGAQTVRIHPMSSPRWVPVTSGSRGAHKLSLWWCRREGRTRTPSDHAPPAGNRLQSGSLCPFRAFRNAQFFPNGRYNRAQSSQDGIFAPHWVPEWLTLRSRGYGWSRSELRPPVGTGEFGDQLPTRHQLLYNPSSPTRRIDFDGPKASETQPLVPLCLRHFRRSNGALRMKEAHRHRVVKPIDSKGRGLSRSTETQRTASYLAQ